jgi:hypothetical protein
MMAGFFFLNMKALESIQCQGQWSYV